MKGNRIVCAFVCYMNACILACECNLKFLVSKNNQGIPKLSSAIVLSSSGILRKTLCLDYKHKLMLIIT